MKKQTQSLNETETCPEDETEETLEEAADETIRYHVYGALAVGLVPVPFVDFVAISGIQLNLLKNLSNLYEVPFSKEMVKNLIGVLVGASLPSGYLASISKLTPVIGQSLGLLSSSIIAGASTYALGKVFNRHFSEGGTFLTFDPEKARSYYEQMFQEGRERVKNYSKDQK